MTVILPKLLTERELCEYLGKSKAWAQRARVEGNGPPFVKIGRTPKYPADTLEKWVMATERTNTVEA
jgi:predicted DNA-binding transcriptional regulator AlpA